MISILTDLRDAQTPERTLAAGDYLFRRGSESRAIFGVVRGRLRLVRSTTDGRLLTLHVAREGELFAEAALFADHYHCDAVADLSTRVKVYDKRMLLQRFRDEPDLALLFISEQARRIQQLRAQLELRNVRSARERIVQHVLLSASGDDATLNLDQPLKTVASAIGLSHEAFYRALAELEREGVIVRSKSSIRVTL